MADFRRIAHSPEVLGGRPCVRGTHISVGTILGLLAAGRSERDILDAFPHLGAEDVREALAYAASRLRERDPQLPPGWRLPTGGT